MATIRRLFTSKSQTPRSTTHDRLPVRLSSQGVFQRKREGSVLCSSCGLLVGVNDERCDNCGRRNPGLWGFAPALRALGADLGFVPFVMTACVLVYGLMILASRGAVDMRPSFGFLS